MHTNTHLSKSTRPRRRAGGFEELLALCSLHNERVLTLSPYSRQRLEIMEPAAMQNFGAPGKYRVILTVNAGGLSAPQLK